MNGREKTRTERLNCALTPREKRLIESEASRVGLTVTELIVLRCAYPRENLPIAEYGEKLEPLKDAEDAPVRRADPAPSEVAPVYSQSAAACDQRMPGEVFNPGAPDEPVADVAAEESAEVKYRTLDLDGTKVKCCEKCYMMHGAPNKRCKTCITINGVKR